MLTMPSSLGLLSSSNAKDNVPPTVKNINRDNPPNWTTNIDESISDPDSNIDWSTFQFEGTDLPLEDLVTNEGTWTYDPTTHEIKFIDNRSESDKLY